MGLIGKIKETVGKIISYDQGVEAGEEWTLHGGGPVDENILHQIHVSRGIETPSWPHFNAGFTSVSGSRNEDDDEP